MSQLDPTCGIAIFAKMRPWLITGNTTSLNVPVIKTQTKTKAKMRTQKEIAKTESPVVYPIFFNASAFASNTFWKASLLDASKGFIPPKFIFNHTTNILSYKNRTKIIECQLDPNNPQNTATIFQNFLRVYGGIVSPDEVETYSRQRELQERANIKEINSWKEIRSQSQRRAVIYNFVSGLGIDKCSLNSAVSTINLGLLAGYFNSDNIQVSNGQIISIDGLIADPNGKKYYIDPSFFSKTTHRTDRRKKTTPTTRASGKRNTTLTSWEKFLIDFERKLIRQSINTSNT